ncbi:MAG: presenilin family intramembrane aspartyl protease [Candidatus Diapherotrites archaeon]
MDKQLLSYLVILFLATQLIGLFVGNEWIKAIELQPELRPTIVNDNPEDISNSIGLIVYILSFTAGMLIAIKLFKKKTFWIFKLLESLAVLGASWIVFVTVMPLELATTLSLLLILARFIFAKNLLLRNIATILSVSGAGAFIGISLGVIPVLVFAVLLAVYDYIAVFKTKHMVTLAKNIVGKNLAFTFGLPSGVQEKEGKMELIEKEEPAMEAKAWPKKELQTVTQKKGQFHLFELGAGDMVIPLVFAVSVLGEAKLAHAFPIYWISPALILLASLIGLIATMVIAERKIGRALPALPLQTALMVLVWLGLAAIGF